MLLRGVFFAALWRFSFFLSLTQYVGHTQSSILMFKVMLIFHFSLPKAHVMRDLDFEYGLGEGRRL